MAMHPGNNRDDSKTSTPSYGLLDEESGNFVGFFHSEDAALKSVLDTLSRYGADGVSTLALAHFVGSDVEAIASGQQLADRARRAAASPKMERRDTPAVDPAVTEPVKR
ncbi:MAG TPA: hypothetical protein VFN74_16760 [Chloroflexota bacterium]|nr:hypothetical protein [Chloroflexota bacterium]